MVNIPDLTHLPMGRPIQSAWSERLACGPVLQLNPITQRRLLTSTACPLVVLLHMSIPNVHGEKLRTRLTSYC